MKKSMSISDIVSSVEAKICDRKSIEGFVETISLLDGHQASQLATAIANNEQIIQAILFILTNWWMDMPLTLMCLDLLKSVIPNCEKSALDPVTSRRLFDRLAAILRETKGEQASDSMFQTVFNLVFNFVEVVSDKNVIGSVGADWQLFADLCIGSGAPQCRNIATILHRMSNCDVLVEDPGFLDGLASILITEDELVMNALVFAFTQQIDRFCVRGLQGEVPTSVTEKCLTSLLLLDDARNCAALIGAVRKLCEHESHRRAVMECDIDFNIVLFNIYDEEVESDLTSLFNLVESDSSPLAQAFRERISAARQGMSARKSCRLQDFSRQITETVCVANVREVTPEMEARLRRIYEGHFEANGTI